MQVDSSTLGFYKVFSDATLPTRATTRSAGYDLYALEERTIVNGCGSVIVPTGIAVQIPDGCYARIAMRSGLAVKQHLAVNAGVVDADFYPNPMGVVVFCTKNDHHYKIVKGERFAQLIIERIHIEPAVEITNVAGDVTAHAGFGSTGK